MDERRPEAAESRELEPAGADEIARTTGDRAEAEPERVRLCLAWRVGPRSQRVPLAEGLVPVGAHLDNSIVLDDPCVSRFHFRLHLRPDGRLWLRDLGSRNGTFVDGLRVAESQLLPGACIRAGGTELRVEPVQPAAPPSLPGFLAQDPALGPTLDLLARAAPSRLPVLLCGESGTGKEVAARALHELSSRARGPFVPVNCGAIAAELAESELFGHERGAFTGAVSSSVGAFGAADEGTLFLDEIGELPLSLQAKLLRALESDEIKAVGAPRPRKVDVRVVCASHRDLRAMVQEGSFREDLYWRLRGAVIAIPPLRERQRDILPLAEQFLREADGGAGSCFATDARVALLSHRWPGNVRELRQVVRLAALLREGPQIRAGDLRLDEVLPAPDDSEDELLAARPTLAEVEAVAIRASHARHRGLRRAMAAELGIAKSSLLRKLTALGLR